MNRKILAIIPARGGSKGIPRKNIREFAGKPLIAWTIEEAKKSKYIDRLILSSDDDEIIKVAKQYGCEVPFKRPKELAQDDTPGIAPVLHAIEQCPGYDYVVLLQPTSPLRTVEDIDGCIEQALEHNDKLVVSITEQPTSPYWMYTVLDDGIMQPLIKQDNFFALRQELPRVYALNGGVYVGEINKILKKKQFIDDETLSYIMPAERSIDIDNEIDFTICEQIFNLLSKKGL